ncbi:MAG TPA: hypothetical protein VFN09_00795 [Rhodanobacteraceae bacterium]|nr:hypothetical protein [Rhodanobacteraceae bacterium]
MNAAVERIVVQTTRQEKRAIFAKAKRLNMTVSELMRSGAAQYLPADADLIALAEAAQASAVRSMQAMDAAFARVAASNARIAAMEAAAVAGPESTPLRSRKTP